MIVDQLPRNAGFWTPVSGRRTLGQLYAWSRCAFSILTYTYTKYTHTEKSILNLVNANQSRIVIIIFRFICRETPAPQTAVHPWPHVWARLQEEGVGIIFAPKPVCSTTHKQTHTHLNICKGRLGKQRQACSCPRDWRLSRHHKCPIEGPQTSSQHCIMPSRGLREAPLTGLNCELGLTVIRYEFFFACKGRCTQICTYIYIYLK